MVKVKIKGTVITAQYGTLQSGDILTTNEEFAKHLVTECNAAEYIAGTLQDAAAAESQSTETETSTSSEAPAKRQPAGKSKKAV